MVWFCSPQRNRVVRSTFLGIDCVSPARPRRGDLLNSKPQNKNPAGAKVFPRGPLYKKSQVFLRVDVLLVFVPRSRALVQFHFPRARALVQFHFPRARAPVQFPVHVRSFTFPSFTCVRAVHPGNRSIMFFEFFIFGTASALLGTFGGHKLRQHRDPKYLRLEFFHVAARLGAGDPSFT